LAATGAGLAAALVLAKTEATTSYWVIFGAGAATFSFSI